MELDVKQSVLDEFRDYIVNLSDTSMFCYINKKQDYTYEMIKAIANWLDAKLEKVKKPTYQWFELFGVITAELEKISYFQATQDKLYPQTQAIIEEEILRQCSIKFNKTINEELDELINDTLDDLHNTADKNPLNIK